MRILRAQLRYKASYALLYYYYYYYYYHHHHHHHHHHYYYCRALPLGCAG